MTALVLYKFYTFYHLKLIQAFNYFGMLYIFNIEQLQLYHGFTFYQGRIHHFMQLHRSATSICRGYPGELNLNRFFCKYVINLLHSSWLIYYYQLSSYMFINIICSNYNYYCYFTFK